MKLLFKQRIFSWLDSYDIYDQYGNTVFTVEGKLSWGHMLHIMDNHGNHIATVKEVVLTFLPRFELYVGEEHIGTIEKRFTLFKPSYLIDFNGWNIEGDFFEWDYTIEDASRKTVAVIGKEVLHLSDTYTIEVANDRDAIYVLMVTLAIDAEKCSRN